MQHPALGFVPKRQRGQKTNIPPRLTRTVATGAVGPRSTIQIQTQTEKSTGIREHVCACMCGCKCVASFSVVSQRGYLGLHHVPKELNRGAICIIAVFIHTVVSPLAHVHVLFVSDYWRCGVG